MPMEDVFLATEELAERFHVDPGTIRRWRHEGRLPRGVRVGRRVLIRESALVAWEQRLEHEQALARKSA